MMLPVEVVMTASTGSISPKYMAQFKRNGWLSFRGTVAQSGRNIQDLHTNTKNGLHTAAMAASWMGIVYGVAGYRYLKNTPTFRPQLPDGWTGVGFSLPSAMLRSQ
jgi:hypothetical protein